MKRTVYLIIISAVVFGSCNQPAKEAVKFYESGNTEMKSRESDQFNYLLQQSHRIGYHAGRLFLGPRQRKADGS